MNQLLESVSYWLADYLLAATVVLLLVYVVQRWVREPAVRIAISWGTAIGLLLLVVIVSLPGRPSFSLQKYWLQDSSGKQNTEKVTHPKLNSEKPTLAQGEPARKDSEIQSQPFEASEQDAKTGRMVDQQTEYLRADKIYDLIFVAGIIVYIIGSLGVVGWLCLGWVAAHRLRKRSWFAPTVWRNEFAGLTQDSRVAPQLLLNQAVGRAIVLGVWRPAVVLPEFLLQEDIKAVRAVLRHELAHVEHRDLWLAMLMRLLLPLLYIHPLFWWLRRQILIDQEYLADEVAAVRYSRTKYAENLIRWARESKEETHLMWGASLGLWESPRLLSQRVQVLLDESLPVNAKISRTWFRCAFAFSIGVAGVASLWSFRPANAVATVDRIGIVHRAVDLELGEDASDVIHGKVVDVDGKPLAGVLVDAWTWCEGNETRTDESGRFRLAGFERDQRVQVRFSKERYSPQMFLDMEAGAEKREIALDQATYIEGRVVDANGVGVARAQVRANQGPKRVGSMMVRNIWSEAETDEQGRYRLYIQPDRYEVEATHAQVGVAKADPLVIAASEVQQLDFQLEVGATFSAELIDANTGEPASGVRLWAWRRPVIDARSDESGMVRIENVPPGKYRLHFESDRYARWWFKSDTDEYRAQRFKSDGWRREFDFRNIEITKGMPPLEIFVEQGVKITGRVLDPDGQMVKGATVAPVRTGSGNSLTGDTRFSVETGANGEFEMLLPASDAAVFNLIAHDGKYREWRGWANGVSADLQSEPGETIADIQLQLTRPGVVQGRVVDVNGDAIGNREVYVHGEQGRGHRYYEPQTETTEDGSFELKYLRPGGHVVSLSPKLNVAEDRASALVSVQSGETVGGVTIVASD